MSGHEWQAAEEPTRMWREVRPAATPRKARLFCAACVRRHLSSADPVVKELVALVEAMADGQSYGDNLYELRRMAREPVLAAASHDPVRLLVMAACHSGERDLLSTLNVSYVIHEVAGASGSVDAEYPAQASLLRDIFANPFRPVVLDAAWRTETTVAIARGMYESRDFSAMPILADALQDAGCENADILNHCRNEQQPHVRGCWVVDLVLGKS